MAHGNPGCCPHLAPSRRTPTEADLEDLSNIQNTVPGWITGWIRFWYIVRMGRFKWFMDFELRRGAGAGRPARLVYDSRGRVIGLGRKQPCGATGLACCFAGRAMATRGLEGEALRRDCGGGLRRLRAAGARAWGLGGAATAAQEPPRRATTTRLPTLPLPLLLGRLGLLGTGVVGGGGPGDGDLAPGHGWHRSDPVASAPGEAAACSQPRDASLAVLRTERAYPHRGPLCATAANARATQFQAAAVPVVATRRGGQRGRHGRGLGRRRQYLDLRALVPHLRRLLEQKQQV
jgi:hypothetical protein